MASPWVTTKVALPRLRRGVVDRPRLVGRLAGSADAKLTLVSAPAGFGKTTAVTVWLASSVEAGRHVAWVSLDGGDSQPESFWTYVALALQTVTPAIGASVLQGLEAGQPASQATVTTLLNDITEQDLDIELVLDDYHLADSPDVAAGMTFLLDHLPSNLRVVIATRADPDLPLSRLRARGELVDVRARDLRFTDGEAAAYLRSAGAPELAPADVATLTQRTEGWAAALQLAALSMHGRDDVGSFVAGFAGTDRYVVDYLVDEVLARQPDDVRAFLLRTSVLDRLTSDLCDAVMQARDGRVMLEFLYRENLFIIPLDDTRQWYRYHHLFADVLQTHLLDTSPDELPLLHARASAWYAGMGDPASAVRHALLAGDVQRAADVAERAAPVLERDRREATVRAWVDEFPEEVVRRRPVLAIAFVGALMRANDSAAVDTRLRQVESWLPAIHARLSHTPTPPATDPDPDTMVVIDEDELARVPAAVHLYRAALALVEGDLAVTVDRAQRAEDEAPIHDETIRGAASALSGLASWASGDLESAHDRYEVCIGHLFRAGHLSDVLGCTIALADIRITQGLLADARQGYEDALGIAKQDPAGMRGVADMLVGLAEVSLERGEIEAAREQLARAHDFGEALGLPQFPYRWRAASAVLAEAEGDPATALDFVTDAERVYVGDFSPDVRPLHARKARIEAALGDVEATARWATDHRVTVDEPLTYAREFEHVTLAEVLLAQHAQGGSTDALDTALTLLDRLDAATEAGRRRGTRIDVLALRALAADAAGDTAGSLAALEVAVALAEPEGQVRAFARHGRAMGALLDRAEASQPRSPFWARLRHACEVDEGESPPAPAPAAGLVDPLSAREIEILRLLATDLDGPEIARHLVVSVNTVRTHTKNIYAKLGVNSRRAAVSRARELGLLPFR